jgi:polysaccharide biosynthesis protein PslA
MKLIRKGILQYIISDYVTAAFAWFLFLIFRKQSGDHFLSIHDAVGRISFGDTINILLMIPIGWLLLHLFSGSYFNPYRKSRLNEIYRTLITTILGAIVIFFVIVVNDKANDYGYYPNAFFTFLAIQFFTTALGRNIILTILKNNLRKGLFSFNTLIIGGNKEAVKIYLDMIGNKKDVTNSFSGFVYADESGENGMSQYLSKLGSISELEQIIEHHHIDEVIIAIDTEQHHRLQEILTRLSHKPTVIKISPDMYDIISGSVRTNNVLGAVMIEIYPELMPDWQRVVKRALDISVSLIVMILLIPLYIFSMIKVKMSSIGDIFYQQERIGLHGKPFYIIKFRSMYADAEKMGPALSKEDDPRITPWGRFMRKWRIDELPQFYNILKGDMSLVGPRPERKHFIDLICATHPHYHYLHKVKPGLTSWGMVKYGYAENTDQMKDRMKYDLLYIKNCSLALDTKIMIYTILVILQGRGK